MNTFKTLYSRRSLFGISHYRQARNRLSVVCGPSQSLCQEGMSQGNISWRL